MAPAFETALAALDTGLFRAIPSQLSDADKRSLLAVQKGVRSRSASYTYLEIGSHLGGSIQPHLQDPRCGRIYSIDPRPETVADDRGETILYPKNSSAHMLDLLRGVQPDRLDRITVFDSDAQQVPAAAIGPRPDICFIDGEHTDRAAWSDYSFCRPVLAPNGVIVFHDANIIYLTLRRIMQELTGAKVQHTGYVLPSAVFVIEFGTSALCQTDDFRRLLQGNAEPYFYGLESMEHYRTVYNRPGIKFIRDVYRQYGAIRRKLKGGEQG
jgi:hypothetical protein